MIECPSCGRQHRPGTLFCSECGIYLPTGGPLRTEPLPEEELPASRANPWAMDEDEDKASDQKIMRILVVDGGRQAQIPVVSEVYLGRLDAAHGIFPDLDLTADGGLEGGVSRRHAKIHRHENRFFIEDVGSANGTFLNGQRLTPYLPHPIQNSDEIQLGKLKLVIEFS